MWLYHYFFVSCNTDAVIEEPDVANSEPLENMSATCEGISEFKMDAEAVTESSFDQSKNFAVVLKENIADKTKTDIYLVDPQNGQEIYYMTQSEI